jgi:hypothetical protein
MARTRDGRSLQQIGLHRGGMREGRGHRGRRVATEALVQAQHRARPVLGRLDRLDDHTGIRRARGALEHDARGGHERMIEPVALADHLRQVSGRERRERVREPVRPAVGRPVGVGRRAQQVQADEPVLRAMPVLRVVEEREPAVLVLGRDPLVRGHLELRGLGERVLGHHALDVPELDLAERRPADARRAEFCSQHPVSSTPLDGRVEPHHVAAGLEDHPLMDAHPRRPVRLTPHDGRPVDRRLDMAEGQHPRRAEQVLLVDVPGVERPDVRVAMQHDAR